jgi:hypothetical protein
MPASAVYQTLMSLAVKNPANAGKSKEEMDGMRRSVAQQLAMLCQGKKREW